MRERTLIAMEDVKVQEENYQNWEGEKLIWVCMFIIIYIYEIGYLYIQ